MWIRVARNQIGVKQMEAIEIIVNVYLTGEDITNNEPHKTIKVKSTNLESAFKEADNVVKNLMWRSRNGFITVIKYKGVTITNSFNRKIEYINTTKSISYVVNCDVPSEFLNLSLKDMMCKHVLKVGEREQRLIEESKLCGYDWCKWGTHSGNTSAEYHKNIINTMIKDNYNHSVRIVRCRYHFSDRDYYWVDNLHSTIKYMKQFGKDITLRDIPFYIIDLTGKDAVVYGYREFFKTDLFSVVGAIESARQRVIRSNSEKLVSIDYRVSDFIDTNLMVLI